jgi:hypothetical protein
VKYNIQQREKKLPLQKEEYFSLLKRQKIPSLEGTKKSLVSIGVFPFLKGLVKKKYRNSEKMFLQCSGYIRWGS